MSIEDALKALSESHGAKALAAAYAHLQGQVRVRRKAVAAKIGLLASTYVEAMRIWDRQKADGVSKAEREKDLEKTLRVAWPQTRAWRYLCDACRDIGIEILDCPGDTTCGRVKPHLSHDYGRPCVCRAGARFREKSKPQDELATNTKGQPTRVGR